MFMTPPTSRYLALLLPIIGIIGYGLTIDLFPKVHPAAKWRVELDRRAVIDEARSMARIISRETSSWDVMVTSKYYENDLMILNILEAKEQKGGTEKFFSPLIFSVKFTDPASAKEILVELTADRYLRRIGVGERGPQDRERNQGPPAEIDPRSASDRPTDPSVARFPSTQDVGGRQLASGDPLITRAQYQLKRLYPALDHSLILLSEASISKDLAFFRYRLPEVRQKDRLIASPVLIMRLRAGEVERLDFLPGFTRDLKGLQLTGESLWSRRLSNLDAVYVWFLILLGIIYFIVALALRRLQPKLTLRFFAAVFVLFTISSLAGEFADSFRFDIRFSGIGPHIWLTRIAGWLLFGIGILTLSFIVCAVLGSGMAISLKSLRRKTVTFELLLKGRLLTQPVLTSILAGLASGGLIAMIPLLIAKSNFFSATQFDYENIGGSIAGRFPALGEIFSGGQLILFTLFAIVLPLVTNHIKSHLLSRVLAVTIVIMVVLGISSLTAPTGALLLSSALIGLTLSTIYFNWDLLAVTLCVVIAKMAATGAFLLTRSNPALHRSGGWIFIILGFAIGSALILLSLSREVSEEELAIPRELLESRAERERLKAGFTIARRAQEQILPQAPPMVQGYDISAICIPSRDVGGDLYDFITFSDGRIGIVVADVSGKGVSASLYMTLTKGLLNSLAEELSDAGEILRAVNLHLYHACRRKVFVTLFLGIIDPVRNVMQYARAGHNPTIYHNAESGISELLESRGIGLGLGGSTSFDPLLTVRTIEINSGDSLLFYSDGITEAMNEMKEEYGTERLIALVANGSDLSAEQFRDRIMKDLANFLGNELPQDDQTLVVVKSK